MCPQLRLTGCGVQPRRLFCKAGWRATGAPAEVCDCGIARFLGKLRHRDGLPLHLADQRNLAGLCDHSRCSAVAGQRTGIAEFSCLISCLTRQTGFRCSAPFLAAAGPPLQSASSQRRSRLCCGPRTSGCHRQQQMDSHQPAGRRRRCLGRCSCAAGRSNVLCLQRRGRSIVGCAVQLPCKKLRPYRHSGQSLSEWF